MSCKTIFEKRGRWCFIGTEGYIKKFKTKEEAIEAGGVEEDSEPQVNVSGVPYKVDADSVNTGDED